MERMHGLQRKEKRNDIWIKYDTYGYEGLAEVLAYRFSILLETQLTFLEYTPFAENGKVGCMSKDIAPPFGELISLQSLFPSESIPLTEGTLFDYYIPSVIQITGLQSFGEWLTELIVFDMLIRNEDRNPTNIMLYRNDCRYDYAPVMDNANSLGYRYTKLPLAKPLLIPHEQQSGIFKRKYHSDIGLTGTKMTISDLMDYYDKINICKACEILQQNVSVYFGQELEFC